MENTENVVVEEFDPTTVAPDTVLAQIVKRDDGYHVINLRTNEEGPVCKIVDKGVNIRLTKNDANRKFYSIAELTKAFEVNGVDHIDLVYKASKHFGGGIKHLPGENLIKYLSEEEQAEYRAIMERAIAARAADKAPALTEDEKIKRRIAKLQEQLAKLEGSDTTESVGEVTGTTADGKKGKKSK